jgi:hypothetical protein
MQIAVLGIDLGKNSCSVVGLDAAGRAVLRRRVSRDGVVKLAAGLPRCVTAMEACCGAHHLGRVLRTQGHQVRLMSPEYVRPYAKGQKNVWPTPSASGLVIGPGTVCCNVSGTRAKPSATMEIRAARSS